MSNLDFKYRNLKIKLEKYFTLYLRIWYIYIDCRILLLGTIFIYTPSKYTKEKEGQVAGTLKLNGRRAIYRYTIHTFILIIHNK